MVLVSGVGLELTPRSSYLQCTAVSIQSAQDALQLVVLQLSTACAVLLLTAVLHSLMATVCLVSAQKVEMLAHIISYKSLPVVSLLTTDIVHLHQFQACVILSSVRLRSTVYAQTETFVLVAFGHIYQLPVVVDSYLVAIVIYLQTSVTMGLRHCTVYATSVTLQSMA